MVVSKFRHFLFACVFLKRNVKAVGPSYQGSVPGVEHWMISIIGHGNYIQAYYLHDITFYEISQYSTS